MNKEKKIPRHVAIIPDGNRRWAAERSRNSTDGHLAGYELIKNSPAWFFDRGVEVVSFYAFSTENWKRSAAEVNALMMLMRKAFGDNLDEFHEQGYKLLVSGRLDDDDLKGDLADICREAMAKTRNNSVGTLNICLNYGGRAEIEDAVKKMINNNVSEEQVHQGIISKYMYNPSLPDPDIIIRTGKRYCLSGFMLWQSEYAELFFLDIFWPEFEEYHAEKILEEYFARERRKGGD